MQLHSLQDPGDAHRRAVDLCKQAGVGLVRDECYWHLVEPLPGTLAVPEHVLANARYTVEQGLELLLILNYGNHHYDGGMAPHSDTGRAAFARYVATVVGALKGLVRYYEVWNEPNLAMFWQPRPNADDYAALLRTVYETCKRVDPDSIVIGGVTSAIDDEFTDRLLELGAMKFMDAFSVHPYITPHAPEERGLVGALRERVAGKLAARGYELPIWITEVGWSTDLMLGNDYAKQADMLARTYLLCATVPSLQTLGWYWFGADSLDNLNDPEKHYGLFYQGWTPKPAWLALDQLTHTLGDDIRGTLLDLPPPLHGVALPSGRAAIWSASGPLALSPAVEGALRVTPLGALGAPRALFPCRRADCLPLQTLTVEEARRLRAAGWELDSASGPLSLCVGPSPLLLEGPALPALLAGLDTRAAWGWTDGRAPVLAAGGETTARLHLPPGATGARVRDLPAGLDARPTMDADTLILACAAETDRATHTLTLDWLRADGSVAGWWLAEVAVADPARLLLSPARQSDTPTPGGVRVWVDNMLAQPLSGRVSLHSSSAEFVPAAQAFELPADATRAEVVFQSRTSISGAHPIDVTARLELDGGAPVEQFDALSYTVAARATGEIVIDAQLDDWPLALSTPLVLGLPEQLIAHHPRGGTEDETRAVVYVCWDERAVYLAALVDDDILSSPASGHTVYKNDGLEVYFDIDHDGDAEIDHYNGDDFQYGLFWSQGAPLVWNWSQFNGVSPGASIAGATRAGGYVLEAAIPWSELGATPRAGLHLGFNVALTDDDYPVSEAGFGQERQWSWSRRGGGWRDPRVFADLFLGE